MVIKTKTLLLLILLSLFTACNTGYKMSREVKDAPYIYVDFKKFKEGRPCGELRFECLPESQKKAWQEEPLADGLDILELNSKTMNKYEQAVKAWNKQYHEYMKNHPKATIKEIMMLTSLDREFFRKVEAKEFLVEMEESLAKEFPGFWKNTSKKVRYRWMRRAMNKAKKFGYKPKQNNQMIELCARIGLDFDLNPKWKAVTEFIQIKERYVYMAVHYIDFTVFEKDCDKHGTRYTDWHLKDSLSYLPYPKRPVPKLNN